MILSTMMVAATQLAAADDLQLKDITRGIFRAEGIAEVRPMADGESYACISRDGKRVEQYSFKTGQKTGTLFDLDQMQGTSVNRIDGYLMSPDGKRMLIQTNTRAIYRRSATADYYIYTIGNSRMEPLSDNGPQQAPLFSPDGLQVAFVRDNNIFLVKLLYDNAESQVTKDGKRGLVINGVPDWVYEEEFSTAQSMAFSADSKQLCWIRYDESKVREYSLQLFRGMRPTRDDYAAYPGFYTYKYPISGEDNAKVSVMSFDIKSRQTRTLQVPLDADGYIPRLWTTKDATSMLVATMNRHQDCLRIYSVNPLSTVSRLLIEEKVPKYVKEEVLGDIRITDGHILMPSDRDGYMHLYLYTLSGQLERQIEQGSYEVSTVYGYNELTGETFLSARKEGPTDLRIYKVDRKGRMECLTEQPGTNHAIFSSNYKYFVHSWSDMNHPTVYTLRRDNGKLLTTLEDNQQLLQKLSRYQLGTRELFTFTTSEGVTLNGWMVKPADFDPAKRYPVIMYQYGGPGSQQVTNKWDIGMAGQGAILEMYLAQQGYLCVCVDNRGTGGRGAEFEKCTYLRLGELESRDQVETALWLGQQSYVDREHIGIWGWSYGGWNTLMSMSEGRPVFCAGVAIAPPTSWRYYDTIYSERYMRTPKENPRGYDEVNPIARVEQLHGALLICHGLADDNVHFRNTAEYTEALVQADKDFKENIYTNRNHSIYGGNTRNHLFRQAVNFFNEHLK